MYRIYFSFDERNRQNDSPLTLVSHFLSLLLFFLHFDWLTESLNHIISGTHPAFPVNTPPAVRQNCSSHLNNIYIFLDQFFYCCQYTILFFIVFINLFIVFTTYCIYLYCFSLLFLNFIPNYVIIIEDNINRNR